MKKAVMKAISWVVVGTFMLTNISWAAPVRLASHSHLRPGSARIDAVGDISADLSMVASDADGDRGDIRASSAGIPSGIFQSMDIRARNADEELTDENCILIGKAYGTFLRGELGMEKEIKIAIGKDVRRSSPRIFKAFIEGVQQTGVKVIDIATKSPYGITSTPLMYDAMRQYKADGGVEVTASHLPEKYNGFKLMITRVVDGKPRIENLTELELQGLYKLCISKDFVIADEKEKLPVVKESPLPSYIKTIQNMYKRAGINLSGWKIVVDVGNGTTQFAKELYKGLGAEVELLYEEPDGTFPNHVPDPDKEENLRALQAKVRKLHKEEMNKPESERKRLIGICYDTDGDRVGFVTGSGRISTGNHTLVLLAMGELQEPENKGGRIMISLRSAKAVDKAIEELGGKVEIGPVGYGNLRALMYEYEKNKTPVIFAGEDSGHVLYTENDKIDDGMYTSAKLVLALARSGKDMDAVLDKYVPTFEKTKEARMSIPLDWKKFSDERPEDFQKALELAIKDKKDKTRVTKDLKTISEMKNSKEIEGFLKDEESGYDASKIEGYFIAMIRNPALEDFEQALKAKGYDITKYPAKPTPEKPVQQIRATRTIEINGKDVNCVIVARGSLHEPVVCVHIESGYADQTGKDRLSLLRNNREMANTVIEVLKRHPDIELRKLRDSLALNEEKLQSAAIDNIVAANKLAKDNFEIFKNTIGGEISHYELINAIKETDPEAIKAINAELKKRRSIYKYYDFTIKELREFLVGNKIMENDEFDPLIENLKDRKTKQMIVETAKALKVTVELVVAGVVNQDLTKVPGGEEFLKRIQGQDPTKGYAGIISATGGGGLTGNLVYWIGSLSEREKARIMRVASTDDVDKFGGYVMKNLVAIIDDGGRTGRILRTLLSTKGWGRALVPWGDLISCIIWGSGKGFMQKLIFSSSDMFMKLNFNNLTPDPEDRKILKDILSGHTEGLEKRFKGITDALADTLIANTKKLNKNSLTDLLIARMAEFIEGKQEKVDADLKEDIKSATKLIVKQNARFDGPHELKMEGVMAGTRLAKARASLGMPHKQGYMKTAPGILFYLANSLNLSRYYDKNFIKPGITPLKGLSSLNSILQAGYELGGVSSEAVSGIYEKNRQGRRAGIHPKTGLGRFNVAMGSDSLYNWPLGFEPDGLATVHHGAAIRVATAKRRYEAAMVGRPYNDSADPLLGESTYLPEFYITEMDSENEVGGEQLLPTTPLDIRDENRLTRTPTKDAKLGNRVVSFAEAKPGTRAVTVDGFQKESKDHVVMTITDASTNESIKLILGEVVDEDGRTTVTYEDKTVVLSTFAEWDTVMLINGKFISINTAIVSELASAFESEVIARAVEKARDKKYRGKNIGFGSADEFLKAVEDATKETLGMEQKRIEIKPEWQIDSRLKGLSLRSRLTLRQTRITDADEPHSSPAYYETSKRHIVTCNPNIADREMLMVLSGVSGANADRIIEARKEIKLTRDNFRKETGISTAVYRKIKNILTFEGGVEHDRDIYLDYEKLSDVPPADDIAMEMTEQGFMFYTGGGSLITSTSCNFLYPEYTTLLVSRKDIARMILMKSNSDIEAAGLSIREQARMFVRTLRRRGIKVKEGDEVRDIRVSDVFDYIIITKNPDEVRDYLIEARDELAKSIAEKIRLGDPSAKISKVPYDVQHIQVNINEAGEVRLCLLAKITPDIARKIIAVRNGLLGRGEMFTRDNIETELKKVPELAQMAKADRFNWKTLIENMVFEGEDDITYLQSEGVNVVLIHNTREHRREHTTQKIVNDERQIVEYMDMIGIRDTLIRLRSDKYPGSIIVPRGETFWAITDLDDICSGYEGDSVQVNMLKKGKVIGSFGVPIPAGLTARKNRERGKLWAVAYYLANYIHNRAVTLGAESAELRCNEDMFNMIQGNLKTQLKSAVSITRNEKLELGERLEAKPNIRLIIGEKKVVLAFLDEIGNIIETQDITNMAINASLSPTRDVVTEETDPTLKSHLSVLGILRLAKVYLQGGARADYMEEDIYDAIGKVLKGRLDNLGRIREVGLTAYELFGLLDLSEDMTRGADRAKRAVEAYIKAQTVQRMADILGLKTKDLIDKKGMVDFKLEKVQKAASARVKDIGKYPARLAADVAEEIVPTMMRYYTHYQMSTFVLREHPHFTLGRVAGRIFVEELEREMNRKMRKFQKLNSQIKSGQLDIKTRLYRDTQKLAFMLDFPQTDKPGKEELSKPTPDNVAGNIEKNIGIYEQLPDIRVFVESDLDVERIAECHRSKDKNADELLERVALYLGTTAKEVSNIFGVSSVEVAMPEGLEAAIEKSASYAKDLKITEAPEGTKLFPAGSVDIETARKVYRYIGISMGANKLAVSVNDGNNEIIRNDIEELRWDDDPRFKDGQIKKESRAEEVMDTMVGMILKLLKRTDTEKNRIKLVSTGLAGPVDKKEGIFGSDFKTPGLPFDKYHFRDELIKRLHDKGVDVSVVKVCNDAEAARNGERFSPKGQLRGIPGGIVIIGGGINISVDDERIKEAGHNLYQVRDKTTGKIHYTWSGDKTKGKHPIERGNTPGEIKRISGDMGKEYVKLLQELGGDEEKAMEKLRDNHPEYPDYPFIEWGEGLRDFEDRLSGSNIRRRLKKEIDLVKTTKTQELDEYKAIEKAASKLVRKGELERALTDEAKNKNKVAIGWIEDIGEEIGKALAAFINAYRDEDFAKHLVLVSGVNENLGNGVYDESEKDKVDKVDIYMKALRQSAQKELVDYFKIMNEQEAEKAVSGIVRSKMDYRRELTAHQPTDDEVREAYLSATKSSSAGEAKDISGITEKLTQPTSALISTEAAKLDMAILDKAVSTYQKAIEQVKTLKAKSPAVAVALAESLREAEASLGVMTLSKDIAAEEAKIKRVTGTIIINDAEIPANQKILLTLLDKENSYLKALEEKLGCKVRLLSQFDPDTDTSANMIAISKAKIDSIANLRYINLKAVTEDMYLPLEQVIVFAKGLLVYGIDKSAATETAISNIYRLLAKRPIQKELLEEFLKPNGVFMLSLPAPTPVDKKYYGELHKQAIAALIAA